MPRAPAVWLVSVVLFAAAASPHPEPDPKTLAEALRYAQHGLAELQGGDAARAKKDLERALRDVPALPEAHVGLGHLATREKRYEDALREYRAAEAGYRTLAPLLLDLAEERYARGQEDLRRLQEQREKLEEEAQRNASQAASQGEVVGGVVPQRLERMRADLDAKIRQLQAAAPPARDASQEPPAILAFFEGNALFSLGRTDEAIAAWERARARDPAFAPVENNLAVAYWKRGRIDDARAALVRAEKLGFKVDPRFRADLAAARARAGPG